MEAEKITWISQKILPDDPGTLVVDWDTFNVGLLEEGQFRTIYTCWSQEDADYILAALRWFSEFQEKGIMSTTTSSSPSKKRVTRKRAEKPNS